MLRERLHENFSGNLHWKSGVAYGGHRLIHGWENGREKCAMERGCTAYAPYYCACGL